MNKKLINAIRNKRAGIIKRILVVCSAALCIWTPSALGQRTSKPKPKGSVVTIPLHQSKAVSTGLATANASVTPLPAWNYSVVAYDGNTYSGAIIGRSPYYNGKTSTTIGTQVIPLVITISDNSGTVVYDPTAPDDCVPGHNAVEIITKSPIFTNNNWVMNDVKIGRMQYSDAFQRAEFWSLVGSTPYKLILKESTLASQALSFGNGGTSGPGSNFSPSETGACETVGVVNINDLSAALESLITGPLAGKVNVGTFPLFLTKNVFAADVGTDLFSNCCALGFHSAFNVGKNIQIYGPFAVDTANEFGPGFTDTMSHEVLEAIDDPYTNNTTPVWGNQGQVSGCPDSSILEVGDPLTVGGIKPTSNEFILTQNGLTYDLQELAFFSWFYGGPSLGAGGIYSDNGTFTGHAKPCPPGGTF